MMKQISKINIMTIFLITIIITGCDGLPTTNDEVFQGSKAIDMKFIVNAPPAEVYENSRFRVGIDLTNIGAKYNAVGFLLLGFESEYLEMIEGPDFNYGNIYEFDLVGRTLDNPYGESKKVFFDFQSKEVDRMTTHHKTNIFASACYAYKTSHSTSVCVDTDIYNEKESEKTCQVKDMSFSNQGAPVAITKIEYDIFPQGENLIIPTFKIHVKNIGSGKVIDKDSIHKACSSESITKKEDFDIIQITAKLGTDELECSPTPLHLEQNNDYVRCNLPSGISRNFVTYSSTLNVELTYGYMENIAREVDIKKIIE